MSTTSRPSASLIGGSPLQQMLSFYVPARARTSDPETSQAAAESWDKNKLTVTQAYVLSFFEARHSGTDRELERWIGETYPAEHFAPSSLRKRRGDLVEKGILANSGEKLDGMIVWALAHAKGVSR